MDLQEHQLPQQYQCALVVPLVKAWRTLLAASTTHLEPSFLEPMAIPVTWCAIPSRLYPYRYRSASRIAGATAGWLSTRPSYPRLPMYHVLNSESSAASNALPEDH